MGLIDFDAVLDDLLLLDLDLDDLLRGLLLYNHRLRLSLHNLDLLWHWGRLGRLSTRDLTLHFLSYFDFSAFCNSDRSTTITTISRTYLGPAKKKEETRSRKFRELAPIGKIIFFFAGWSDH